MRIYVHWKYTRTFDLNNNLSRPHDITDKAGYQSGIMRALLWLYVACNVFLDQDAKNAVIDHIVEWTDELKDRCIFTVADHIHYVWENTGSDSKLRKHVLVSCAAKARPLDLADMAKYPPEFFHELSILHTTIRGYVPSGLPALRATMARPSSARPDTPTAEIVRCANEEIDGH
ncbi:hypothetical protein LTR27_008678 [Elasticomyces elasticus]|nr:hypothetical protein LTR27_008678 [Elasticomyces elasticus]